MTAGTILSTTGGTKVKIDGQEKVEGKLNCIESTAIKEAVAEVKVDGQQIVIGKINCIESPAIKTEN